ncbi:hypothetical protein OR1_01824 [Geobacter sp. OR-1]|uniref:hypothetical protein n=1 Tax=Geobacter sp. OR-1 TaxID=1266765 RepID=UPI000543203C|nr:hypothetical protein [Geobacter sp. OR-1]GAM09544.1 hypothetical protein OR1_01824 [Geobacter sp. OR-1]
MEKGLADSLMEFYQQILKPEFDTIKGKQAEHDDRFSEAIEHFDALYHRLGRIEDEYLVIGNSLKRIEDSIGTGSVKRSDLERRFREIKDQFTVLQGRLDSIEKQMVNA